jgi:localization factor PodJL
MRPDLPWNVAGIPSEAREAARAAARREGLSVGEWLTRRIVKEFAGESESYQPMRETFSPAAPAYRPIEEPAAPRLDTSDMMARVSRNESETADIYRRIETQLGGLGRRMEATERSNAENNRAMSKAATEINIAAREQAQAFDQLSSHVVSLANRLDRVEQASGNDSMKEAVKTLHQGLSRLAEQIGTTAKQSATQIEALANNLESVAAKVADVRTSAEGAARTMEQRMAMLDERVRVVERVSHSSADALDKALENMEARQQQGMQDTADIHRRVGSVEHLNDALDRITSRFASSEAQTATAIARMEDNILRLDSRGSDPAIDRRLNSIERTLGDIVAKFQNVSGTDESIRRLSQRLDAAEARHDDIVAELRAAPPAPIAPVSAPAATAPTPAPSLASAPSPYVEPAPFAPQPPAFGGMSASASAPLFDAPPFPETRGPEPKADPFADAFAPVFAPPPHPEEAHSPFGEFAPQAAFDASGIPAAPPPPATNESFLAAARRSAQAAAAATDVERSKGFGGFNWGPTPAAAGPAIAAPMHSPVVDTASDERKPGRMRYLLIGGAALVLILAIASVILSQRAGVDQAEHRNGIGQLLANSKPLPTKPAVVAPPAAATPIAPAATTPPPDSFTAAAPPKAAPVAPTAAPAATTPPKTASVTALDKLTAMANAGNARAELVVALKYLDGDGVPANDAEGAKWLEKAAAQGEPLAQYRLGTLYERGKGVTADAAKATKWYAAAAQSGNRKAMHNLAVAYAQGSGVAKNFTEAARWFSRASALGLSDSQFNLAVLYERGLGVPQSLVDAYKWYAIAASQGDTESKTRIDALATQISADDRAAAQRAAEQFKPQPMDRHANSTPDINDVTRG